MEKPAAPDRKPQQVAPLHKQYIADGVYVRRGAYFGELVLTTEDGVAVGNVIVLGLEHLDFLDSYVKSWRREIERAQEKG